MRNVKQLVREALEELPDDCTWEDVQYRLYHIQQTLHRRTEDADRAEVVERAEVEQRLVEWLKK